MATAVAWRDEYKIGVEEIDRQHEILVGLINRLYTAMVEKSADAVIDDILAELVRYTIDHFAAEEQLMRECKYRQYAEHKATHDRITERIQLFVVQYRGGHRQIGMDLLYFLKDWLMRHINEEDRAYAPQVRGVSKGWLSFLR